MLNSYPGLLRSALIKHIAGFEDRQRIQELPSADASVPLTEHQKILQYPYAIHRHENGVHGRVDTG